jgi:hypothetical protein
MANVELLRETLDHIKNNPQTWKQDVWFTHLDPETHRRVASLIEVEVEEVNSCKTAFCFAGHAALKSGFPSPPKNSFEVWTAEIDGKTWWVDSYAADKLGITYDQADVLFAGENSLKEIEDIVNAIIENPEISEYDLNEMLGRNADDYCCDECAGGWDDEDDDDDTVW